MHVLDGARAKAGGDQRHVLFAATVADLADIFHGEIGFGLGISNPMACKPDIMLNYEAIKAGVLL